MTYRKEDQWIESLEKIAKQEKLFEYEIDDPIVIGALRHHKQRTKHKELKRMSEKEHKKPIRKYRKGQISVSVWENESQGENKFNYETYTFQRSYKNDKDEWQNTQTLRKSDLPELASILNKIQADSVKDE